MIRIWPILLTAAAVLWFTDAVDWSRSGHLQPLTVADAIASLGLPVPRPGPGELADFTAGLLASDGGLFCLLLTMASMALESILTHSRH
jgi:hypothetical protein